MLALRAKQIIEQAKALTEVGHWSDKLDTVMTPGERAFVKEVWKLMPGHTCFVDALRRVEESTIPMPKDNRNSYDALLKGEISLQSVGDNKYYLHSIGCILSVIIFSSRSQLLHQNKLDYKIKQQDKEFLKCVLS